jgi:hypothetical protein
MDPATREGGGPPRMDLKSPPVARVTDVQKKHTTTQRAASSAMLT